MPRTGQPLTRTGQPNTLHMTRRDALKAMAAGGTLVIAGCSSTSSPPNVVSSGSRRGGTAELAAAPDINLMNLWVNDNANFPWRGLVFNTLTELNHATHQPMPALASSWQFADNGRTLTMQLRSDVHYHTGRPFGPADVIFSVQQMAENAHGSQLRSTAQVVTDMSQQGANGVTLRLAHAVSNLFDMFELMPVVDSETISGLATGKQVIGTGPFRFGTWTPGVSVTFSRFDSYWKPGLPYLNSARFRVIPQAQALDSALLSGEVDLIVDVSAQTILPIRQNPAYVVTREDSYDGGFYLGSNVLVPPLNKKEVRQALAYAINSERLLQEVFLGIGKVTSIPWAPGSPAYTAQAASHYTYDPALAKQLLAQAGASSATLSLYTDSDNLQASSAAQSLQYDLEQVGLKINSVSYDNATFEAKQSAGQLNGLFADTHGFGNMQPATLVLGAFPFNIAGNASNFLSPEYTNLAHAAWTASTPAQAQAANAALTAYLLDQQFVSDLISFPRLLGSRASFQGFGYSEVDIISLDSAHMA